MIQFIKRLTALSALGWMMMLTTHPAFARYGYQCFKDTDRNQYCSCIEFGNHAQAAAWIGRVIQTYGVKMKPGSDTIETTKRDICTQ